MSTDPSDILSSSAVPARQPLSMPAQDLRGPFAHPAASVDRYTWTARVVAFGGTAALTAYAAYQMWVVIHGFTATHLQWLWMVIFVITFAWIAFSASNAIAGLIAARPHIPRATAAASSAQRTALVMPVYNEDPAATSAVLEAMALGLARLGGAAGFEIFIISDTRDPDIWVQETGAYWRLRARLQDSMPVWYRRRHDNTGRKAGNVRDLVEQWGGRYDFMIVLDADSLMTPETLLRLVAGMVADPRLGILQTVPTLRGGTGLFARLQQFAGFVYGPVIARGIAAWQGDSGNYWGHNAIIRVSAFAAACGLPELPGRPPFGGTILSHDFVEAALMRRAGWHIRMLPPAGGSWEDTPPTLLDVAARDRRWAQGNLQHVKVIGAAGLAWPSRVHFVIGIMSYLASPLWLALIGLGLIIAMQALFIRPEYFAQPFQLFPSWPRFDTERMIGLFVFSMVVLLTPKLIGVAEVLRQRDRRLASGGGIRVMISMATETILSALYAPILMLIQTHQIGEILRGRDAGWQPQRRSAGQIVWQEIWARHWCHVAIGVAVTAFLGLFSPLLLAWMSPTLIGLGLAVPLSAWSGSVRLGMALRRMGIFLVPEETSPHPIHAAAASAVDHYAAAVRELTIQTLLASPEARRQHFDTVLPAPPSVRGQPDLGRLAAAAKIADARSADEALHWLDRHECAALLADRSLFALLVDCGRDGPPPTPPVAQPSPPAPASQLGLPLPGESLLAPSAAQSRSTAGAMTRCTEALSVSSAKAAADASLT